MASIYNTTRQQLERKRLADERESLYNELKRDKAASADGLRSSLFMQFGLEKQKKRKLKLVSMLWEVSSPSTL
jgi:hypothetical protein